MGRDKRARTIEQRLKTWRKDIRAKQSVAAHDSEGSNQDARHGTAHTLVKSCYFVSTT